MLLVRNVRVVSENFLSRFWALKAKPNRKNLLEFPNTYSKGEIQHLFMFKKTLVL
jgi:hypothetical protein